jgi:hypothetical protein
MKLIGLVFALIATTAKADCVFGISGPAGHIYAEQDIANFVVSEIRPALSTTSMLVPVRIIKVCNGSTAASLEVLIDSVDYYIVNIQRHSLTEQESKYTDSDLALSRSNLDSEFDKAMDFEALPLAERQDVVKTLAFYFAETARFSDVEQIANALLAGGCTQDWSRYAHLLRRWGRISWNAIQEGLGGDGIIRGGVNDNLIAPISRQMIDSYNTANPADVVSIATPVCL